MNKYTYWLDKLKVIKKREKMLLLKELGSGEDIFKASMGQIAGILGNIEKAQFFCDQRNIEDIEKEYDSLLKQEIKFFNFMDDGFPERLRTIPDPPFNLYYLGELPREQVLSVAVIGARECSEYGKYVAKEIGKTLGENGIQVISGMARGIDGISQQSALQAGGTSTAVLGCSVDICYPKENRELYDILIKKGGVVSTYYPTTEPNPRLFPPRNRIVSGLADVLIVVEARHKSGTIITVDMALEQGRDVYVVPGRVTDRLSDGCNKLLKDGAHVFLSPDEFLNSVIQDFPGKIIGQVPKGSERKQEKKEQVQGSKGMEGIEEEPEKIVLKVLDFYPKSISQIRQEISDLGYSAALNNLTTTLMRLCMNGQILQVSSGWFQVKA